MKACHDNGIEVPGDLSVLGFSNTPESAYYHPSLTTIDQCYRKMASEALRIAVSRLKGELTDQAFQREVEPVLIKRESTSDFMRC
jgi:DNA-binding LacI/PurR family transcriptional regulator